MLKSRFIPTSKRAGECPICGNTNGDCRLTDGDLIFCQSHHEDIGHPFYKFVRENEGGSAGVWGIFAPRREKKHSPEYRRQQLELQRKRQQRLEEEAKLFRSGLSRKERDRNIRLLHKYLGLKAEHRAQLQARGLTDQQIDDGLFFSISPNYEVPDTISEKLPGIKLVGDRRILAASKSGIACVAFDHTGLAIGFQLRDEKPGANNKYLWAKATFSSHLQTGELPITKHGQQDWWVLLTEGLIKPYVTHCRLRVPVIGASNAGFIGAPLQFRACLGKTRTLAIALDGGDALNPHVLARWESFLSEYKKPPYRIFFTWWGQWQKSDPDIDEVDSQFNPQWLTVEQMENLIIKNVLKNFWIILALSGVVSINYAMEAIRNG